MNEIWGLANCDHDGDHFRWMFTSRELAQHVADKLNPHRSHYYRLEPVPLPMIDDEYDERVSVEAIPDWERRK